MKLLQYDLQTAQPLFENPIFWFLVILGFIINIFIIRAVFNIPQITKALRAQAYLTGKIAEAKGVEKAFVDKILIDAKIITQYELDNEGLSQKEREEKILQKLKDN